MAKRAELEEQFAGRRDPFPRAENFGVHDLLDPRATRPALVQWLEMCEPLLETLRGPSRYGLRP